MHISKYSRNWSDIFEHSLSSPSGLLWARPVKYKAIKRGDIAGYRCYTQNNDPRSWDVKFEGESFIVHRIIYAMIHGSVCDTKVIDHIDGNPFNNTPSNLRQVTQKVNCQNKRKNKNNSTGIVGVCWVEKNDGKYLYAKGEVITPEGMKLQKHFPAHRLGVTLAFCLASAWRQEQIKRLNSESENYTNRHIIGG